MTEFTLNAVATDSVTGQQGTNSSSFLVSASTETVIVSTNFDNFPTGPMSLANFRLAMNDPNLVAADLGNTSIVDSPGRGRVIRETLLANQYGVGITTDSHLPVDSDEITIQYDVMFDANFQWGWGGKLPGLGGSKTGVKPSIATGCNPGTSGAWSARGMWITPGSYPSVTGSNEVIGYMYNTYKTDTCGQNIRTATGVTAGQWHTVKQYHKMNTITGTTSNADGIHRMWIDGAMVVNNASYRYRSDTDLHANNIFWEIFRGGNTSDWATSNDCYVDIDNLLITTP